MRKRNEARKLGFACILGLSLAAAGAAQEPADGLAILKKVQDTYTSMKTFQAEGKIVSTLSSPTELIGGGRLIPRTSETPFSIAIVQPDRLRVENRDEKEGSLKILQGKTLWTYTPKLNKYSEANVSTGPGAREKASAFDDFNRFRGDYKKLLEGLTAADVLREESLRVNGHDVECYVVRVERKGGKPLKKSGTTIEVDPTETLWIDKSRFLVLKKDSGTIKSTTSGPLGMEFDFDTSVYFEKAAADEPVPEELFSFVPPPGATKVLRTQVRPKSQPPKPH